MDTPRPEEARLTKCRYMAAAYPELEAEETCSEHRHDAPTFALARAMATAFQGDDPTVEQIAWSLDDAGAVVDDFDPAPLSWNVMETVISREPGLAFTSAVHRRAGARRMAVHPMTPRFRCGHFRRWAAMRPPVDVEAGKHRSECRGGRESPCRT